MAAPGSICWSPRGRRAGARRAAGRDDLGVPRVLDVDDPGGTDRRGGLGRTAVERRSWRTRRPRAGSGGPCWVNGSATCGDRALGPGQVGEHLHLGSALRSWISRDVEDAQPAGRRTGRRSPGCRCWRRTWSGRRRRAAARGSSRRTAGRSASGCVGSVMSIATQGLAAGARGVEGAARRVRSRSRDRAARRWSSDSSLGCGSRCGRRRGRGCRRWSTALPSTAPSSPRLWLSSSDSCGLSIAGVVRVAVFAASPGSSCRARPRRGPRRRCRARPSGTAASSRRTRRRGPARRGSAAP